MSLSHYILTQNSHPRATLQWCSTIPGIHSRRLQTSLTKTWMSTALNVLSYNSFEVQLSSEFNVCSRSHQAGVTCWKHSVQSTALELRAFTADASRHQPHHQLVSAWWACCEPHQQQKEHLTWKPGLHWQQDHPGQYWLEGTADPARSQNCNQTVYLSMKRGLLCLRLLSYNGAQAEMLLSIQLDKTCLCCMLLAHTHCISLHKQQSFVSTAC